MDVLLDGHPAAFKIGSDCQKDSDPHHRPAVGEQSKLSQAVGVHAGPKGGEMPNAGDEIANEQYRWAEFRKKCFRLLEPLFRKMELGTEFMQKREPQCDPKGITD